MVQLGVGFSKEDLAIHFKTVSYEQQLYLHDSRHPKFVIKQCPDYNWQCFFYTIPIKNKNRLDQQRPQNWLGSLVGKASWESKGFETSQAPQRRFPTRKQIQGFLSFSNVSRLANFGGATANLRFPAILGGCAKRTSCNTAGLRPPDPVQFQGAAPPGPPLFEIR